MGDTGSWAVQRWLLGDVSVTDISWEPSVYQLLDIDTEMKRRIQVLEKDQKGSPEELGFEG